MVVETRLVARLLGVRLLRVDGTVLMSPGRLVNGTPAQRTVPGSVVPAASPRRPSASARVAPGPTGVGLAEAARLLHENQRSLRRLR